MMAFMIIEFLVGIGSGFSPNIVVFTLLRFLLGFAFTAIGGNARITGMYNDYMISFSISIL